MKEHLRIDYTLISVFIAQLFTLCELFEAVAEHSADTLQLVYKLLDGHLNGTVSRS